MVKTKGIILAGGKATRLFPVTRGVSKQLLPVYNKPMIYYPLSVLMLAGIKDILIITTKEILPSMKATLGNGSNFGIKLVYKIQDKPNGLAEAFIIGEDFIGKDNVCLILGDNIFYGHSFSEKLRDLTSKQEGATVFGYYVKNPQLYGIVSVDKNNKALRIEEKPKKPKSNWAVTGLYFYDNKVINYAKNLKPSKRGELEITDLNNIYLKKGMLDVKLLGRGYAWLDTGNYDSLLEASMFIKTIEERQGIMIGSIEEVAYRMGYINAAKLKILAKEIKTDYGINLLNIIK